MLQNSVITINSVQPQQPQQQRANVIVGFYTFQSYDQWRGHGGLRGFEPPLSFVITPVICTVTTRKFLQGADTAVCSRHTCACELQNVISTRSKEKYSTKFSWWRGGNIIPILHPSDLSARFQSLDCPTLFYLYGANFAITAVTGFTANTA